MVGKTISEQIIDDFIKSIEGNALFSQALLQKLKMTFEAEDRISKTAILSLLETEAKDESA